MDKLITLTEKELEDLMIESSKDYKMTHDERHNMSIVEGTNAMVSRLIDNFKIKKYQEYLNTRQGDDIIIEDESKKDIQDIWNSHFKDKSSNG